MGDFLLTALDATGHVVNLLESAPIVKGEYSCPACRSAVRLHQGEIVRPYFAHVSLGACDAGSEAESAQHLALKAALYDWFQASGCEVQLEHYLPALAQTPDLLVGGRLAIEVQCSRLSVRRLRERTAAYQAAGYSVLWLMGRDLWLGPRLSGLQRQLVYFSRAVGFHYWELDLAGKRLRLRYLLHQTLRGGLHGLSHDFRFGAGDLLQALRYPYMVRQPSQLSVSPDKAFGRFVSQQLYHLAPRWMALQAQYYQQGRNLLTERFDGLQVTPLGLSALTGEAASDFCQLADKAQAQLTAYYQAFQDYYQDRAQHYVYPPAFYSRYFLNKK